MPKEKTTTRKSAKSAAKADGGKKKKGQFDASLFATHRSTAD